MAPPAIARSRLVADLRALGVREGSALMVHVRMSALGWVVGGSETVVASLLEALGPEGTLMAYASWQEHVYHADEWPAEHRDAYLAEPPVFDPATAEAARDHGRIPERVRTWPGAERSVHPEASMVAIGPLARELTADHPPERAHAHVDHQRRPLAHAERAQVREEAGAGDRGRGGHGRRRLAVAPRAARRGQRAAISGRSRQGRGRPSRGRRLSRSGS